MMIVVMLHFIVVFTMRQSSHLGSIFPDYLEVPTAVVVPRGFGKHLPVHRYRVDIFSYSGPSGILGSDRKQNKT